MPRLRFLGGHSAASPCRYLRFTAPADDGTGVMPLMPPRLMSLDDGCRELFCRYAPLAAATFTFSSYYADERALRLSRRHMLSCAITLLLHIMPECQRFRRLSCLGLFRFYGCHRRYALMLLTCAASATLFSLSRFDDARAPLQARFAMPL